jgi:hypothetical protein
MAWAILLCGYSVQAQDTPPASQWIAPDAVAVLEISQPKVLMDVVLDSSLRDTVTSSPAYQEQTTNPQFRQMMGVIKYFEGRLGTDWRTGLGKVLGGGVTLAVRPNDTVVAVFEAEDENMLGELNQLLLEIARAEAAKQGQPDRVASADYRGVTGWTFGKNEVHAILGKRLVISNKPDGLKNVIDLRAEPGRPSLDSSASYQAAKKAAGADAVASLYVDLKTLKQVPQLKKALEQVINPGVALLVGGEVEAVRNSTWLALGLSAKQGVLSLAAAADGQLPDSTSLMAFARPDADGEGALPILSVPRQIAGLTFYRDLHAFYASKDELFPERTSGLIFFENMMGIFFTGRDLTEEVLGETRPEIRFVVAEQEYDPAIGKPDLQIPAFAAVFRLRNPEQFGRVVEEAWQKAVGLVNFTRGQQALPGLIIDRPVHDDLKFTVAYFAAPEEPAAGADARFNYRPALAMLDDYLILSSTDGLACDLIDALKAEAAGTVKPLAGTTSALVLNAGQLASVLQANFEGMVSQNMVKEGNTREQAETEVSMILLVLEALGRVTLDLGAQDGLPQATLTLSQP